MARWVEVLKVDDLPPGRSHTVDVGDRRLALFNDGGTFYAIDDTCPHQGASLSRGAVHAGRVMCPLHSWVFELETGRCPGDSHDPVEAYRTRCAAGAVEVWIPQDGIDLETA